MDARKMLEMVLAILKKKQLKTSFSPPSDQLILALTHSILFIYIYIFFKIIAMWTVLD